MVVQASELVAELGVASLSRLDVAPEGVRREWIHQVAPRRAHGANVLTAVARGLTCSFALLKLVEALSRDEDLVLKLDFELAHVVNLTLGLLLRNRIEQACRRW